MKPVVDKLFASIIPPLSKDEYLQLEENLLLEGCRDPLVVWGNILIDGHNRLRICEKHGIPYQTATRDFANQGEAISFIITNQLGRRNLSLACRSVLALKLDAYVHDEAKSNQRRSLGRGKKAFQNSGDLFGGMSTDRALGIIAGVSHDSIHKVRKIVEYGTPEQIERVKKGGKGDSINAVYKEVREAMQQKSSKDSSAIDPDLHHVDDTDAYIAEFSAFANGFICSMDAFTADPRYARMGSNEQKMWIKINETIISAAQKNILFGAIDTDAD